MKRRQQKLPPNQVLGGESFFKPKVQAKLAMGTPGDKYEVEADHMADQVVNKTGSGDAVQKMEGEEEVQQKPLAASVTPLIQKMGASEEEAPVQKMEEEESVQAMEEEEPVQKMEEEESVQAMEEEEPVQKMEEEEPVQAMEEEEPVQKMEEEEPVQAVEEEEVQAKTANTTSTNANIEGKLRKGSGGSKMDATTQTEMESGFGADFSNVNIHTDSEAAQMSQDIGAQAFTHGNDVYFNEGKYNPDSKEGKHLLAHELTHTIQQKGMIQKKVQKKRITYDVTSTVAAPFLGKSSTTRVYKPTFKVEPYKKGSNWRVKIIHVTAKGDIEIVPFPATHIPNPAVGGNITDNKAGGTNAGYHCDVIADLKDYTSTGAAGPRWHVTQASIDHENYHWNKEWKKTLNKYWRKAQRKIKRLKFSDTNTEAQAQVHFDTEVQTIIDKMHTDASIKYAALPDNAGSKPYKAGQKALNKMIRKIKRFRKSQKWKKC